MKLYHYSKEKHKVIESLQARNKEATGERLNLDVGSTLPPYSTSISFFLNTIPSNLPEILDFKHNFWKPGKLFENIVDSSSLPEDVIFNIAETPEWIKFTDQFDWSKAKDPDIRKSYMLKIREWSVENGLIGQGRDNFVKQASKYTGNLATYYKRAYELSKKEDALGSFFSKYASYVPHVMLYHDDFKISKFQVKEINLNGQGKLGTECFLNKPASLTW